MISEKEMEDILSAIEFEVKSAPLRLSGTDANCYGRRSSCIVLLCAVCQVSFFDLDPLSSLHHSFDKIY